MKAPHIPEAKEGSITTSNGYTYYVDKNTDKVVRIAPDGSKQEAPPLIEGVPPYEFYDLGKNRKHRTTIPPMNKEEPKTLVSSLNILSSERLKEILDNIGKPKKVTIELDDYYYDCADGCCTNYGTTTKINGEELLSQSQDASTIVRQILEHLGYEVEMIETYNGE